MTLRFDVVEHPWIVLFGQRQPVEQLQFERAFVRLASQQLGLSAKDAEAASADPQVLTIAYDSLPTMLGVMNVAVALDELSDISRACAVGGQDAATSSSSLYDLRFAWSGVIAMHDYLVPSQNSAIGKYLGAFSLLDADGTETVKVAELRHALCRLGTAPLSSAEFQHMLYRHKLLHRSSLTVFEFLRLMLDVPVLPIEEALRQGA